MTALMFFRLSGIILIFGIWTTVAEAGEFWKKKRPEDWTARQALRILQKSPWAKQRRLLLDFVGRGQRTSGTSRGGNISVRDPTREGRVLAEAEKGDIYRVPGSKRPSTQRDDIRPEASREAVYLIRLESAAPVAAAFQRLKELRLESMAKFQAPPPRLPADRYVITVNNHPAGRIEPPLVPRLARGGTEAAGTAEDSSWGSGPRRSREQRDGGQRRRSLLLSSHPERAASCLE